MTLFAMIVAQLAARIVLGVPRELPESTLPVAAFLRHLGTVSMSLSDRRGYTLHIELIGSAQELEVFNPILAGRGNR